MSSFRHGTRCSHGFHFSGMSETYRWLFIMSMIQILIAEFPMIGHGLVAVALSPHPINSHSTIPTAKESIRTWTFTIPMKSRLQSSKLSIQSQWFLCSTKSNDPNEMDNIGVDKDNLDITATQTTSENYNIKSHLDEETEVTYFSPNMPQPSKSNNSNHDDQEFPSSSAKSSINEYSFFDEAIIYVRAGSGGQGSSTYKKGIKSQDAQPDGGSGGKGGDVYVQCDSCLNTLAGLTNAWRPNTFGGGGKAAISDQTFESRPMSFRAGNGLDGARGYKSGRYGNDVVINVPPGTVVQEEIVIDEDDGEQKTEHVHIGTVSSTPTNERKNNLLMVASGGMGGEGSGVLYKAGKGVRRVRSPPIGGERKRLKLILKIVADVALVGVPNAGKSTFLASVTRAKPKIADYPFTTVIPNLGVWIPPFADPLLQKKDEEYGGSTGIVLCDVPGLIAGAAEGVGLGHAFLRHVERCHVILHLVDATSIDPIEDFNMLNREIVRYGNGKLAQMPQIVVINKIDAWDEENDTGESNKKYSEKGLTTRVKREQLEEELRSSMKHSRLMFMSAKDKIGVDDLMTRMSAFLTKVKDAKSNV